MSQDTQRERMRPEVGVEGCRESSAAGMVGEADPEVVAFRAAFGDRSPLDELVREGAQRMLQAAIEAEVEEFLVEHAPRRDEEGRRLVVRNGFLPTREILTGAGSLAVRQPRVRDNDPDKGRRVRFSSSILPPYLRRSKSIEELIPWLYPPVAYCCRLDSGCGRFSSGTAVVSWFMWIARRLHRGCDLGQVRKRQYAATYLP